MTIFQKGPIGVFDSGFGGLTILKGIVEKLPSYHYIFLADSARSPYGTRSHETIRIFTKQAVEFLFNKGCNLVILACNTASSDALRDIQQTVLSKKFPGKRVLGVIIPSVEQAILKTTNNRIGVMATEATVTSNSFVREIKKIERITRNPVLNGTRANSLIRIFQKACPMLVPLVESGEYKSEGAKLILKEYVQTLLKHHIDTLILACTHYELLEPDIKKIAGKQVAIISQSGIVAEKLNQYLKNHPEIESRLIKEKHVEFYSTDLTENFKRLGTQFFGRTISVEKVSLE